MRSVVQVNSGPPLFKGPLAQLGERLICIQEVSGSIPLGSTISSLKSSAEGFNEGLFLRFLYIVNKFEICHCDICDPQGHRYQLQTMTDEKTSFNTLLSSVK